ncbi:hypothetical protein [Mangrovicoccus algicola]|uniref:DNA cytosine methyltransferase n=1 Tax=Mangrovicoccus algicola TaxID=2771008 RepID=A0A8J6YTE5_9RHOB|nr:hypothetical protein [Mangrovicoccus algicola]MBE3637487.1 hypothetical protein [Mangrovicoccus algicola]
MRVLVACETSGVVRRAFARRGHDAWSCDLLPAEDGANTHFRCDAREVLHLGWDLLMVAHPPCTRLCNSGVRWLHRPPRGRSLPQMWAELEEGVQLFADLWHAPVPRVCVENPVMHRHARERLPHGLPRPQIVQPWWFGDPAFKATGLYLRDLPPLEAANRLVPPRPGTEAHRRWSAIHRAPPGPDRWKFRSRTFEGLAEAMAEQWGTTPERRHA